MSIKIIKNASFGLLFFLVHSCNYFTQNQNQLPDESKFYKEKLPVSSKNIREWGRTYGSLLPDYAYYMRADASREAFIAYIDSLDLHLHNGEYMSAQGLDAEEYPVKEWWVKENLGDSLFCWTSGGERNIVRYAEGSIFLYASRNY